MSDPRYKRKEIERGMIRSMQARLDAARPKPVLPRCKCGLTAQEVPAMWLINGADHWGAPDFRCPACMPADLKKMLGSQD